MEPERRLQDDPWRRLEELFDQARRLDQDARKQLLTRECGADPTLRRELEDLLAHATESATRIGQAVATAIQLDVEAPRLGDRLGVYRLIEILGRGGLSTVYLAERDDQQYEQQVAIKVIRVELDSEDLRDRFRQEQQILATLDHPNIARLLDGGTSRQGLPYFVMERIAGLDLETYCETRKLGLKDRLDLFRKLCSAVSYAHRQLIIHRDLKPSNILVTDEGVPKLLDFGIAKPLEGVVSPLTAPTVPGQQMLTPAFASPEQIAGKPLSTATDIYSLGVLLYRLLTGRHPYELNLSSPAQAEIAVRDAQPVQPSQAATEDHLRFANRLKGDLDTIVMKALHKNAERRYASVEQFAEDLARHLDGRAVQARGDSWTYRTYRFLRRHRVAVTVAAGVAAMSVLYAYQLAVERDHARREARKSAEIADVMVGLFEASEPNRAQGGELTVREMLDRGAAKIRQDLAEQPLVRAELMDVIGRIYRRLGLFDPGIELAEEALKIRLAQLDTDHIDVASSRNNLGELMLGAQSFDTAAQFFGQATATRRKTLGDGHRETLISLNNLAVAKAYLGDLETAEEIFREVLERRQAILGPEHVDVEISLNNLADVLDRQGNASAAETLYRQALDLRRSLTDEPTTNVAHLLNNLAGLAEVRGADDEARELYTEALEINRRLLAQPHPDISFGFARLAAIAQRGGDLASAEDHLRRGLEIRPRYPDSADIAIAPLLEDLAKLLMTTDRSAEAHPLLVESLERRQRMYPPGHWRTGVSLGLLGSSYLAAGRLEEARPLLESSLLELSEALGNEHPTVVEARNRLEELASADSNRGS